MSPQAPLAVYYEHPEWFRPLFAELDRRHLPYEALRADQLILDPEHGLAGRWSLVVNRMSPSAWDRGHGGAVFETVDHLEALEEAGTPVLNGSRAYRLDIAKTRQMALLHRLGLPFPKTRVVYSPEHLPEASDSLEFPLLVKPNMGGNGAGIQRFDNRRELETAVEMGVLETGPDGVYLLQEYHAPKGGSIVRAETLGGRLLYAIRVHIGPTCGFSICPADITQTADGRALDATARRAHEGNDARAEAIQPPPPIVEQIERIAQAGHLDVGGVEYLESERDGQLYFYDVNALSNFVADAPKVLGFDPTARFVDLLEERLYQALPTARAA